MSVAKRTPSRMGTITFFVARASSGNFVCAPVKHAKAAHTTARLGRSEIRRGRKVILKTRQIGNIPWELYNQVPESPADPECIPAVTWRLNTPRCVDSSTESLALHLPSRALRSQRQAERSDDCEHGSAYLIRMHSRDRAEVFTKHLQIAELLKARKSATRLSTERERGKFDCLRMPTTFGARCHTEENNRSRVATCREVSLSRSRREGNL